VENKPADISNVQKYLNGELDARAMHELERRAQDDPFLMDALDGYSDIKSDQLDNLTDLQRRLHDRTATKTRRIIPWTLTVAASILGFAIVLGILYKGQRYTQAPKVAMNQPAKIVKQDTQQVVVASPGMAAVQPNAALPKASSPINYKVVVADKSIGNKQAAQLEHRDITPSTADSSVVEDMIVGYMAAKKQDTVLGGNVPTTNNASALTVLKSKVQGAEMTVKPGRPADNSVYALSNAGVPSNIISGVVMNRTDGAPLAGVSVKVAGKSAVTQTDANGKFSMPNVKKDEELVFGSVGYNNKTMNVKGKDSLKVELDETANSLAEVVVTRNANYTKPTPSGGWENYRTYLYKHAVSTEAGEGTVTVRFNVNAAGALSSIKVVKSLNAVADNRAIQLIKDGPRWQSNKLGVALVDITFHK
jgi:TonB family protein